MLWMLGVVAVLVDVISRFTDPSRSPPPPSTKEVPVIIWISPSTIPPTTLADVTTIVTTTELATPKPLPEPANTIEDEPTEEPIKSPPKEEIIQADDAEPEPQETNELPQAKQSGRSLFNRRRIVVPLPLPVNTRVQHAPKNGRKTGPGIGTGPKGAGTGPGIGTGSKGAGTGPGIGTGSKGAGTGPGIGTGSKGAGTGPGIGAGYKGAGSGPNGVVAGSNGIGTGSKGTGTGPNGIVEGPNGIVDGSNGIGTGSGTGTGGIRTGINGIHGQMSEQEYELNDLGSFPLHVPLPVPPLQDVNQDSQLLHVPLPVPPKKEEDDFSYEDTRNDYISDARPRFGYRNRGSHQLHVPLPVPPKKESYEDELDQEVTRKDYIVDDVTRARSGNSDHASQQHQKIHVPLPVPPKKQLNEDDLNTKVTRKEHIVDSVARTRSGNPQQLPHPFSEDFYKIKTSKDYVWGPNRVHESWVNRKKNKTDLKDKPVQSRPRGRTGDLRAHRKKSPTGIKKKPVESKDTSIHLDLDIERDNNEEPEGEMIDRSVPQPQQPVDNKSVISNYSQVKDRSLTLPLSHELQDVSKTDHIEHIPAPHHDQGEIIDHSVKPQKSINSNKSVVSNYSQATDRSLTLPISHQVQEASEIDHFEHVDAPHHDHDHKFPPVIEDEEYVYNEELLVVTERGPSLVEEITEEQIILISNDKSANANAQEDESMDPVYPAENKLSKDDEDDDVYD